MNDKPRKYGHRRVPAEALTVGRNLRKLRQQAGLTQKELAFVLGITFQQVQKYERGENRFPVEKLFLLKNYLDVPYQQFFSGLNAPHTSPLPWPDKLCARLSTVDDIVLRDKIERVTQIMME